MRLPLDRSGRATQIEDGDVVEESGAMGRSWVEDGGVSLLCTDGDGGVMESGAMGCVMESGGVRVERF
jgi:hypothetical protein